jgi:hypothetical protein
MDLRGKKRPLFPARIPDITFGRKLELENSAVPILSDGQGFRLPCGTRSSYSQTNVTDGIGHGNPVATFACYPQFSRAGMYLQRQFEDRLSLNEPVNS